MPASNLYHEVIQVEVRDQSKTALQNVQKNVESTEKSLNRVSANPFTITVKAVDMLSRPLMAVLNQARALVGKGITLPIRMANNALAPFKNMLGSMKEMANQVFQGIGQGVGNSLFALAGQGFGMVKGSIIGMNATLETSTLQFETLMGDSDKAKAHVADLFDFAKTTPFETQPVIDASRMLRTFGGDSLDTMSNLTLFGNAAAATSSDIKDVSFWFGRAYAAMQAGQPFGEATMRLQELAILSPKAAQKLEELQKGGASADVMWKAMTGDLNRFNGAMDRQAGTWEGLTSTLSDSISLTSAKVFAPLFKVAKDAVGGLNDVLSTDQFDQWAQGFGTAVSDTIAQGGKLLGKSMDIGRAIAEAFSGDTGAMGVVYDSIRDIFGQDAANAIQPFLQKVMEFIPTLRDVGRWLKWAFEDVMRGDLNSALTNLGLAFTTLTGIDASGFVSFVRNLADTLNAAFQTTLAQISRLLEDLSPTFDKLSDAVSKIVPLLASFAGESVKGHDAMQDFTIVDTVARGVNGLATAIEGVVGWLMTAYDWFSKNTAAQAALVGILAAVTFGVTAWGIATAITTATQIAAVAPLALWIAQMYLAAAAQAALNAVMMLNPFVLIAGLLIALGAALIYAYNTNEDFRNGVNAAWAAIQEAVAPVIQLIGDAINWLWHTIIEPAIPAILKLWDDLKNDTIRTLLLLPLRLYEIGLELMNNLIKGLGGPDILGWIRTNITDKIPQFIKDALGINSPSSVFESIGTNIMQGLINGLQGKVGDLTSMLGNIGSGIGGALSGAANVLTGQGEIAQYIAQAAQQRGIDPQVALTVAQHEGGTDEPAKRGTFATGSSWWPFQLHYGGAGTPYAYLGDTAGLGNSFTAATGFQPGDPAAWKASVDYALDAAKSGGWGQWYGAAAGGISDWQGIKSFDSGGVLSPGATLAMNNTGADEYVMTPGQMGGGMVFAPVFNIDASGASPGVGEEVSMAVEEQASRLFGLLGTQLRQAFGNLAPEGGAT